MKTLTTLLSLLLTINSYCYFDTVKARPILKNVKVVAQGTHIFQTISLPQQKGAYVIWVENVPRALRKDNINIDEPNGISLISMELINPQDRQSNSLPQWKVLQGEISVLKEELKQLQNRENQALDLKKLWVQNPDLSDLQHYQLLFKEQNSGIRKQRLEAYRQLHLLQEKLLSFSTHFKASFKDTIRHLYLSLFVHDSTERTLEVSYWIPAAVNADQSSVVQADHQNLVLKLKGRVIEAENRFPMVYALVEYYYEKELLGSAYTDEEGLFELELPHRGPYTLVIAQQGYRDRRVRGLHLQPNWHNYRTIAMKAKDPVSALEILSYALPLFDIIQATVKP